MRKAQGEIKEISIHASRVGGDNISDDRFAVLAISIHASRVGGDKFRGIMTPKRIRFQSTPPGWEATVLDSGKVAIMLFQSTPPGWEATDRRRSFPAGKHHFNPRLPGGRRPRLPVRLYWGKKFQSTPPGWEATLAWASYSPSTSLFQSTPPGWEATCPRSRQTGRCRFQSTPPGWEATRPRRKRTKGATYISIHASRVGGDPAHTARRRPPRHFNPRLPGGRRRW